jgi:hypothetical protein
MLQQLEPWLICALADLCPCWASVSACHTDSAAATGLFHDFEGDPM